MTPFPARSRKPPPLASRLPKAMPPVAAPQVAHAVPPPSRRCRRRTGAGREGQAAAPSAPVESQDSRGGEQEAEQALSYLDTADRMEQRLGKYLNSEAVMPKLHKVLADAGIGSRRRWKS